MPTRHEIRHLLDADEQAAIAAFDRCVRNLQATEMGSGRANPLFRIEHDTEPALDEHGNQVGWRRTSTRVTIPGRPVLSEFYMALRLIRLNDEPCEFGRVANIVKRRLNEVGIRDHNDSISLWQEGWRGKTADTPMILSLLGVPPQEGNLIDLWFNHELFHNPGGPSPCAQHELQEFRKVTAAAGERAWPQLQLAVLWATQAVWELHFFIRDMTDLYGTNAGTN